MAPRSSSSSRWPAFARFRRACRTNRFSYPVTNEAYATRIAREWNVRDSGAGYVTRFSVDADYAARFPVQTAGGTECTELWVPAEALGEFNRHIIGEIEVIAEFRA